MSIKSSFFQKQFDLSKAELIGQGNFAKVYRVFDNEINDSLAIRKVNKEINELEDIQKEKIISEELKRVENENILKIYDIVESEDSLWYVTQYCEGGSLWDALNARIDNKMGQRQALECLKQISRGVQELHNHRITHRDLKPENVLLKTKYIPGKPFPVVKIADFGLSTKKIIMETIAGTKQYIAPQQARFHNYTNAVDVWSLGIIFDEILHGSPFYVGENNKQVFKKILKDTYTVRDTTIRDSIKDFLTLVLKKRPYERPIIAVICQKIQKISEEIDAENEVEAKESDKRVMWKKKVKQLKEQKQAIQSELNEASEDQSARLPSRMAQKPPKYRQRKQAHDRQVKPRTPFKRQRQKDKQTQTSTQLGNQRLQVNSDKKRGQKSITSQQETNHVQSELAIDLGKIHRTLPTPNLNEGSLSHRKQTEAKDPIPPHQRINIYKLQRSRKNSAAKKAQKEDRQNTIHINEYIEKVYIKKQNLYTLLNIRKERQFIPNTYLNIADMPGIFQGQRIITTFRKNYSYLNYVSYHSTYQNKLIKGMNDLNSDYNQAQKQINEYRDNLKDVLLAQIDKYVDHYIDKTIQ